MRSGVSTIGEATPSWPELGGTQIFALADANVLRELEPLCMEREYEAGARLFLEGRPAAGVHFLRSGRVKLSIAGSSRVVAVRLASPGELLGLGAVLAGRPHEATAECVSFCRVSFVAAAEFLALLERHPELSLELTVRLAADVEDAYARVCALRQR